MDFKCQGRWIIHCPHQQGYIGELLGLHWGNIRVILGKYWENIRIENAAMCRCRLRTLWIRRKKARFTCRSPYPYTANTINPKLKPLALQVTWFVSHYWGMPLRHTIDAVASHANSRQAICHMEPRHSVS